MTSYFRHALSGACCNKEAKYMYSSAICSEETMRKDGWTKISGEINRNIGKTDNMCKIDGKINRFWYNLLILVKS